MGNQQVGESGHAFGIEVRIIGKAAVVERGKVACIEDLAAARGHGRLDPGPAIAAHDPMPIQIDYRAQLHRRHHDAQAQTVGGDRTA